MYASYAAAFEYAVLRLAWTTTMSESGTSEWIFRLALVLFFISFFFVQIRYLLRRYRSYRWPTLLATVQKGSIGKIIFSKGVSHSATFLAYVYLIEGVRYAGFFALYGATDLVGRVNESLAGETIQVRYGPSDPGTSFIVEYNDPQFGGLTATQNPKWLGQTPPVDLQDAIRGAKIVR